MIHYQDLITSLQEAGLRITPQRIAICTNLAESTSHPTAMSIYEILKETYPSLSLATVYNTMDVLIEQGKVNTLGDVGDAATHFDANVEPHLHLGCLKCHKIIDLDSSLAASLNKEISNTSGYKLLGARVMYYGICPECRDFED
jgi:Fur family peroxide stress response transcriptional regulator